MKEIEQKVNQIVEIIQNKKHLHDKEQKKLLKELLLKNLVHLENLTVKSKSFGSEGILDKFLDNLEVDILQKGKIIYNSKEKCKYVYIILQGEVFVWEKKDEQILNEEIDLQQKLKTFQKNYKQSEKEVETEYFKNKIQQTEQQLLDYRIPEYDKLLSKENNKYLILPKILNFKKILSIGKDSFIGEKEALSDQKFERTFQVYSQECKVLKMEANQFVNIFDLQLKKIDFIIQVLEKNFPKANEMSLKWLAFQFEDQFLTNNAVLFKENDQIDYLYIIREGSIEFQKSMPIETINKNQTHNIKSFKNVSVQNLTEGNFFGYEGLNNKTHERVYGAIAKNIPVTLVYFIHKKLLNKIIYENSDIELQRDLNKLIKVKTKRFEEQSKKVLEFNNIQVTTQNYRRFSIINQMDHSKNVKKSGCALSILANSIQESEKKTKEMKKTLNFRKSLSNIFKIDNKPIQQTIQKENNLSKQNNQAISKSLSFKAELQFQSQQNIQNSEKKLQNFSLQRQQQSQNKSTQNYNQNSLNVQDQYRLTNTNINTFTSIEEDQDLSNNNSFIEKNINSPYMDSYNCLSPIKTQNNDQNSQKIQTFFKKFKSTGDAYFDCLEQLDFKNSNNNNNFSQQKNNISDQKNLNQNIQTHRYRKYQHFSPQQQEVKPIFDNKSYQQSIKTQQPEEIEEKSIQFQQQTRKFNNFIKNKHKTVRKMLKIDSQPLIVQKQQDLDQIQKIQARINFIPEKKGKTFKQNSSSDFFSQFQKIKNNEKTQNTLNKYEESVKNNSLENPIMNNSCQKSQSQSQSQSQKQTQETAYHVPVFTNNLLNNTNLEGTTTNANTNTYYNTSNNINSNQSNSIINNFNKTCQNLTSQEDNGVMLIKQVKINPGTQSSKKANYFSNFNSNNTKNSYLFGSTSTQTDMEQFQNSEKQQINQQQIYSQKKMPSQSVSPHSGFQLMQPCFSPRVLTQIKKKKKEKQQNSQIIQDQQILSVRNHTKKVNNFISLIENNKKQSQQQNYQKKSIILDNQNQKNIQNDQKNNNNNLNIDNKSNKSIQNLKVDNNNIKQIVQNQKQQQLIYSDKYQHYSVQQNEQKNKNKQIQSFTNISPIRKNTDNNINLEITNSLNYQKLQLKPNTSSNKNRKNIIIQSNKSEYYQ